MLPTARRRTLRTPAARRRNALNSKIVARRRAASAFASKYSPAQLRAFEKKLNDSATGFHAMQNGIPYAIARKKFTPEQLLGNGHPVEMLLRLGAPVKALRPFYSASEIQSAVIRLMNK